MKDMTYQINLAGLQRDLELCPLSDTLYIAAFILIGDVEMTVACAGELLDKAPDHDIIITPECKSISLAHEMTKQSGKQEYVVARKNHKLYMRDAVSVTLQSITTAGQQTLYIGAREANRLKGKRVLVVDDVISTGESLRAVEQLVAAAGGIVVGKMAVLAEGDAIHRPDIITLGQLPLFDGQGNPLT